jgi:hypothetical protein
MGQNLTPDDSSGPKMRSVFTALIAIASSSTAVAAVPGVYDNSGAFLGRLMATEDRLDLQIMSPKGYLFTVNAESGKVEYRNGETMRVYLNSTCNGQEYASDFNVLGVVHERDSSRQGTHLVMKRPDAQSVTLPAGQTVYEWYFVCTDGGFPICNAGEERCNSKVLTARVAAYAVETNDPEVTGVSNAPFFRPLRIRMLQGDWTQGSTFQSGYEPTDEHPRDD